MYVPGKRKVLALILWCHCYQIAADLFFNLLSTSTSSILSIENLFIQHHHNHHQLHPHSGQGGERSRSRRLSHNSQAILYAYAAEYASPAEDPTLEASPPGSQPEINQTSLTPGHEIKLTCHMPEHPNEEFSWSRIRVLPHNNDPFSVAPATEEQLSQGDPRFIINKQELIIRSPSYDDVGNYYCMVKMPHDDVFGKKMIAVRVKPYIHEFSLTDSTFKSAIVNEGTSLIIPCNVTDDYYTNITISWQMSKFDEEDMIDVIPGQDGISIQIYNDTSNALVFDRITQDHRRFYKCRVSNGVIENSRVILIRVKNQFTFFWPLVGIIIELVILFGVICVVQKKKVEPDANAYDRKAIQM